MKGQTVVIIGGSSGIGLATAHRVCADGGQVLIMGRRPEAVDQAVANLGAQAKGIVGNADDPSALKRLFEGLDRVDHLLVTTGSFLADPDLTLSDETLRAGMESRFWVSVKAVQAAMGLMHSASSVVLTSGIANWRPEGSPVALASLGAIETFVRGMAAKYAPMRFNCVAPGFTRTPFLEGLFGEQTEHILAQVAASTPAGRLGEPEEIADAIVFLMGNAFVTGVTLTVDGGYLLT